MSRINVLSVDGGGIRGIIPATILAALEQRIGLPLYKVFDLIAGTSTGGIIALGIATTANAGEPYTPQRLVELYSENGPKIFRKNLLTPVRAWLRPKYTADALEEVLEAFFGKAEFSSALTPLLISSYDLEEQVPFFFKSHRIASDPAYNWKVKEIARATSAAPTFFPPFLLHDGVRDRALVDGGIFANNPGMAAYSEARRVYPQAADFVIVSVGTGDRHDGIKYEHAKRWGLLDWAKQITPVMMDSVSEAVDYELDWVLGNSSAGRHFRLQPELKIAANQMDDASPENIQNLKQEAENFLREEQTLADVQTISDLLRTGRGSDMPGIGSVQIS